MAQNNKTKNDIRPGAEPEVVVRAARSVDYDLRNDTDYEEAFGGGVPFNYTPGRVRALYITAAEFWVNLFEEVLLNIGNIRRVYLDGDRYYYLPALGVTVPVTLMPAAFQVAGQEPNPLVECALPTCAGGGGPTTTMKVCRHRYHVRCLPLSRGPGGNTCGLCHQHRVATGRGHLDTYDTWLRQADEPDSGSDSENEGGAGEGGDDDDDDDDDGADGPELSKEKTTIPSDKLKKRVLVWKYDPEAHMERVWETDGQPLLAQAKALGKRQTKPKVFVCPVEKCYISYTTARTCRVHKEQTCVKK